MRELRKPLGCGQLPRVPGGRGAFFQAVPVPDRTFARVGSHLEVLRELQAVGRASVFAKPAEHAARSVVGKVGQHFAAGRVIAMPADHDQIFWAGQRAQVARDTKCFASLRIHVQARRPAVPLRDHRPLQRILLGINILGVLRPESQAQALPEIRQKQPLQE
jgi:hypothetical protein